MQDFEKLAVWRRAHALSLRVDLVVRKMPRRGCTTVKAQVSRHRDQVLLRISEPPDHSARPPSRPRRNLPTSDRRVVEIRRMTYGLRKRVRGDDPNDSD